MEFSIDYNHKKIILKSPSKNDVAILDENGSRILQRTVLKDIETTKIYIRKEAFYFSLKMFLFFAKNMLYFLSNPKILKSKGYNEDSLKFFCFKIYLLSCIECIKPKVVLTFTDNSGLYQWLSRTYKKCVFYAIQNGCRNDAKRLHYKSYENSDEKNFTRSIHFTDRIISMPNFFCFGNYEVNLYKKHEHDVDNFYPVGSLKASYYKSCLSKTKPVDVRFEICLVSDILIRNLERFVQSRFEQGVVALHNLTRQYVNEFQVDICIAMRSGNETDQKIEADYFLDKFGEKVKLFKRFESQWSTYIAMECSAVIIASNSTSAFEAFGWGKKVLFCNMSGDDFYQTPVPDLCEVNQIDYKIFKKKN